MNTRNLIFGLSLCGALVVMMTAFMGPSNRATVDLPKKIPKE